MRVRLPYRRARTARMKASRGTAGAALRYDFANGRRPCPRSAPHRPPRRRRCDAEFFAPADPARHHRRAAVHPARGNRPDRGGAGGAGDRRRPARVRPPRLDRLGLPADLDRGDADLRAAVGHLGPARAAAAGHRLVRGRVRALRAVADAVAAHCLSRLAGHRRGRADGDVAGRHRRRGCAARTRQIPGLHGGDVGRGERRRADPRRLDHRRLLLALDLLDQRADRHRRVRAAATGR